MELGKARCRVWLNGTVCCQRACQPQKRVCESSKQCAQHPVITRDHLYACDIHVHKIHHGYAIYSLEGVKV